MYSYANLPVGMLHTIALPELDWTVGLNITTSAQLDAAARLGAAALTPRRVGRVRRLRPRRGMRTALVPIIASAAK